tara:strand:- start:17 stop:472 length:456 start_codon:yes stop_codon:yes gene_type:complete
MIIKKFFLLFLFLTLSNCGYEAIYLKKNNLNIQVKDYQLEGDKKINRKIISSLNFERTNNQSTGYELNLNSSKVLETVSKDKAGDVSVYRITIKVIVSLNNKNGLIKKKTFSSNFTYNNRSNKSSLSQYQKTIEKNIITEITEDIYIFLNS